MYSWRLTHQKRYRVGQLLIFQPCYFGSWNWFIREPIKHCQCFHCIVISWGWFGTGHMRFRDPFWFWPCCSWVKVDRHWTCRPILRYSQWTKPGCWCYLMSFHRTHRTIRICLSRCDLSGIFVFVIWLLALWISINKCNINQFLIDKFFMSMFFYFRTCDKRPNSFS